MTLSQKKKAVEQDYQSIVSLISPSFMQRQLDRLRWDGDFQMPSGIEVFEVDAKKTRVHFDLGKKLIKAAISNPQIFNNEITTRLAAQRDIVDSFMPIFISSTPRQPPPQE